MCRFRFKSSKGQSQQSPPEAKTTRMAKCNVQQYGRISVFSSSLQLQPKVLGHQNQSINQSKRRFSWIVAAGWRAVGCLSVKGKWLCGWQETGAQAWVIMEREWDRCKYQYSKTRGPWWQGHPAHGLLLRWMKLQQGLEKKREAKWWKAFWNDIWWGNATLSL